MTRNNLREHLSWLLESASRTVDHSIIIRPFETVDLWKPIASSVSVSSHSESSVSSTAIPRSSVTSANADLEFAIPNLSASALRALAKDDMARLQSGPRSSYKSRLLSESAVVSPHTTAPSATGGQSNSLCAQYSQAFNSE